MLHNSLLYMNVFRQAAENMGFAILEVEKGRDD